MTNRIKLRQYFIMKAGCYFTGRLSPHGKPEFTESKKRAWIYPSQEGAESNMREFGIEDCYLVPTDEAC